MDTKLGRIYCTNNEYKYFYDFNSNGPQNFTDRNETYSTLKS